MERIAARLGNQVHNSAAGAAELSLCIVPDDFEFLYQIEIWDHDVCRPANVGVDDPVEEVQFGSVVLAMEGAVGESRSGNSDVAFAAAKAPVLGGRDWGYAGRERQQLREIPPIQRQVVHGAGFDHGAQFSSAVVHQRRLSGNFYGSSDSAGRKFEVLRQSLRDSDLKIRNRPPVEPGFLHGDFIGARLHVQEHEIPAAVGVDMRLDIRGLVAQCDGCSRNHGSGGIGNRSVYFAATTLRKRRKGQRDT